MNATENPAVERARDTLRQLLAREQFIYLVERHRSRSGDTRIVQFLIVSPNQNITSISQAVAHAVLLPGVGFDEARKGLTFHQRGGWQPAAVVMELGRLLFGDAVALHAEWI